MTIWPGVVTATIGECLTNFSLSLSVCQYPVGGDKLKFVGLD
jgi:hypothetical protein